MHGLASMSERKTRRKELICGINCMLERIVYCPNMQLIRREKYFFIPTSSVFLAFDLALRKISLNFNFVLIPVITIKAPCLKICFLMLKIVSF